MQGPDISDRETQGIIPRMVRTVFNRIDNASEKIEFIVKVQMIEIYNEKIKDIIDTTKDNLKINEDPIKGLYVGEATE
jgi:kinesin family protein 5